MVSWKSISFRGPRLVTEGKPYGGKFLLARTQLRRASRRDTRRVRTALPGAAQQLNSQHGKHRYRNGIRLPENAQILVTECESEREAGIFIVKRDNEVHE